MNWKNVVSMVTGAMGAVFAESIGESTLRIIMLVLSIVSVCISLAMSIIDWWQKAFSDKKIDSKEVKEVMDITKKHIDEANEVIKENKENGSKDN